MDNFLSSTLPLEKRYPNLHRFSHTAMATVFEIFILCENFEYAGQAANCAFDLVDRLEINLSRFNPNSDVSRINNLEIGKSIRLDLDTFACLKKSKELFEATDGSFDITAGVLKDFWIDQSMQSLRMEIPDTHIGMNNLQLHENGWMVSKNKSIQIDLGAIGKGYAVDCIGKLLLEWELDNVLINGGKSSVLALGKLPDYDGWPVTISHPLDRENVLSRPILRYKAMGGSGIEKGPHIINPHQRRPIKDRLAAWVTTSDAATADALSTAFMIMESEVIDIYCSQRADIQAMIVLKPTQERGEAEILSWGL